MVVVFPVFGIFMFLQCVDSKTFVCVCFRIQMESNLNKMKYSGKTILRILLNIKCLCLLRSGLETTKSRRSGTWSTQKSQNNYCLNNKNPLLITKVAGYNMISRDKQS